MGTQLSLWRGAKTDKKAVLSQGDRATLQCKISCRAPIDASMLKQNAQWPFKVIQGR